jgi:hypothetical protein
MHSAAARLPQSQVSEHPQSQLFEEEHVAPPGPTWHSSSAEIHVSPHGFPIQHTGFPLFDIFFISVGFHNVKQLGLHFFVKFDNRR